MPVCKFNRDDGQRCKARALKGSDLCYFHAPELRERRQESQRRGGSKRAPLRAISSPPTDFDLSIPSDVTNLLNCAVNRLNRGELNTNHVHAIVALIDCANRARNNSSNGAALIERIEQLERLIHAEAHQPLDESRFESRFVDSDDPADEPIMPATTDGSEATSEHNSEATSAPPSALETFKE